MLNIKKNRQLGQQTSARKETIQYYYRVAALWYETKSQAINLLDWKQLWSEAKEEGELQQFLIAPGYRNEYQNPYADNEGDRRGYTPPEYDMKTYYSWQHQRLTEIFASGIGDISMIDKQNPDEKQLQNIHKNLRNYIVEQLDILLLEPEHQYRLAEIKCNLTSDEIEEWIELDSEDYLSPSEQEYRNELRVKIIYALSELLIVLNQERMNKRNEMKRLEQQEDFELVNLKHAETLMARNTVSQELSDIFTLNGGDSTNVKFTLTNNDTEKVNEVGVFLVDDENGNINGLAPGSDGYLQAALEKAQVIFSAISNRPSGFNLGDIERVIEVDGDARLGFYLISNGTTDTALAQLEKTGTTSLPVFFSDSSNLQVSDLSGEGFKLNWSDTIGNSDFTDMELSVQLTQEAPAPFTRLQGEAQKELIDLRDVTGQVSVSAEVYREAAFDNLIGFYQVVDSNGGIDTNGDGIADFNPGDTGYEEAALTNRVTGLDLLQTDNQQTTTFDGILEGGNIFASFVVVDGTINEAINNNAEVYFSFLGANSDGVDHIRLLGDNTFGFEDLAGGGDFDYNDMIVKVNFATV
ncbi:MAG: DUF4114 domain-containing protein [Nostocales cyanobacterium 94392]|nr:DUF4114 domain-containing protein [Nostocales cyanobacterium 94392]